MEDLTIVFGTVSVLLTAGLGYLAVKYKNVGNIVAFAKHLIEVIEDYEITDDELKALLEEGKALVE